jgi:glycosyltransferase involved in cell wall biosynthesis
MQVAAVVPCYRVKRHILDVIGRIGPECGKVYVVDDACPERTGHFVQSQCTDPRVVVIWNEVNQGVGGAVLAGYRRAIDDGADVIVKIDGDGQMPPELLPYFVAPIRDGRADYTKGNRFYDLESLAQMPRAIGICSIPRTATRRSMHRLRVTCPSTRSAAAISSKPICSSGSAP